MVYLSICLKSLFPYIDFELNKAYIIKTLCVERNKEVNTCQGQCHLNKEIKKNTTQEEDKQNRIPVPNFEDKIYFIMLSGLNATLHESLNSTLFIYLSNYRFLLIENHFHPPEIA